MRRYLSLLLFLGLALGQDVLILKNGDELKGKFLDIQYKKIRFEPKDSNITKLIRLDDINKLTVDGQIVIENGESITDIKKFENNLTIEPDPKSSMTVSNQLEALENNITLQQVGGFCISAGAIIIGTSLNTTDDLEKMNLETLEEQNEYIDDLTTRQRFGFALIALGGLILALGS